MDLSKIKREEIKIISEDINEITSEVIADYETRSGKKLYDAHAERLILNTFIYREALLRAALNEAFRQQHTRLATGAMLDLCGDDMSTPRNSASRAMTTLRFSGSQFSGEVLIPIGTEVSNGKVVFATKESAKLTEDTPEADLIAECTEKGTIGNGFAAGQINQLKTALSGAQNITVKNITPTSSGSEEESDDAYRERILLAPESFSVAGSRQAYEYWAKSVSPDVADVHVGNAEDDNGNLIGGTVLVSVLTKTKPASEALLHEIYTTLSGEKIRPLCDTVIVNEARGVKYSVKAELVLYEGADEVEVLANAKNALKAFAAARENQLGKDIILLEIKSLLRVNGVYDVRLTYPSANQKIKASEYTLLTAQTISIAQERETG